MFNTSFRQFLLVAVMIWIASITPNLYLAKRLDTDEAKQTKYSAGQTGTVVSLLAAYRLWLNRRQRRNRICDNCKKTMENCTCSD